MQIVHVVYEPFDPPLSGAKLRDKAVNAALRRLGETATIAVAPQLDADSDWHDKRIARTFYSIPDHVCAGLARTIAASTPDLIVLSAVGLSPLPKFLGETLDGGKARLIADMHNTESRLLAETDRAKLPQFLRPLSSVIYAERWRRARRVERQLARRVSSIWVCSREDRALFRKVTAEVTPVHVVPNPVPDWCPVVDDPVRRFHRLPLRALYVGHLGYPPNNSAAMKLVTAIWPMILENQRDAELTIAGRQPRRRLRASLAGATNIRLVADPPAMKPLYERADVALMPIFQGGGSRIKILEALAMGLPVVATAKAVEGLRIEPDRHFLLAERPSEYAHAVARLNDDPRFRDRIIAEGRAFALQHHGSGAILDAVSDAIRATVAGGPGNSDVSVPSA